jgi:hypothetical protein
MRRCSLCLRELPDHYEICPHDGTRLAAPAADWTPGALVGNKYRIVSKIGAGGMGVERHTFRKRTGRHAGRPSDGRCDGACRYRGLRAGSGQKPGANPCDR